MVISGVSQIISQKLKGVDDLVSWAVAFVLLAANGVATIYLALVLPVCLVTSLSLPLDGSILSMICFSVLFFGSLVLVSFVMCKSVVRLWPWRDTLLTLSWVAWQAFGFQGHRWPSWVIGVAILFALSATLRWRVYFQVNQRSMVPANIQI